MWVDLLGWLSRLSKQHDHYLGAAFVGLLWLGSAVAAAGCGTFDDSEGLAGSPNQVDVDDALTVKQSRLSHIDSGNRAGEITDVKPGDLPKPIVVTGAQMWVNEGFASLESRSVAVVANRASRVEGGNLLSHMASMALQPNAGFDLVVAYGPEHGVDADVPAGERVDDGIDSATGVRSVSLYDPGSGNLPVLEPNVDTVVFDLQDVGVRSYTYISAMGDAMLMAAQAGARFVVLDRPNPLGGQQVSGYVRLDRYESYVGRYPIPFIHGMTIGELALAIKGERWIDEVDELDLVVVPMTGWERDDWWGNTGLDWTAPSPGLPTIESVYAYPSLVLFEATGLSVGRGTDEPFSVLGAPWVDSDHIVAELESLGLPGVRFEAVSFTPAPGLPTSDVPFVGQKVSGVRVVVVDPRNFAPMLTALHLLSVFDAHATMAGIGPLVERPDFFDLLAGTDRLRLSLEAGVRPAEIYAHWNAEIESFNTVRDKYLIYPDSSLRADEILESD